MSLEAKNIALLLKEAQSIVLFSHISPDGDTIGSTLALYHALKSMDKEVCICCQDAPPANLKTLPGFQEIQAEIPWTPTLAIAIDCADEIRVGKKITDFLDVSKRIVIDHHPTNPGFGDVNWVDAEAAATAELIYQLILELPVELSPEIASCLYAALISDTGNFCYSNTRSFTFEMAAVLLETGFDMPNLVRHMFRMRSRSRTRMMAVCIEHMRYYQEGKIVLCLLDQQVINRTPPQSGDFEGMIDFIRDQENVEIAIMAREVAEGLFKVSFRSIQQVDVAKIAQQWGGGGHVRAAACQIRGDYFSVGQMLLNATTEALASI